MKKLQVEDKETSPLRERAKGRLGDTKLHKGKQNHVLGDKDAQQSDAGPLQRDTGGSR